jgi:hypothetical protein
MIGTWSAQVQAAKPYTIHGDLYYEIHCVDPDNPAQLVGLRVPQHALATPPEPGETLTFTILMGQVTGATRVKPR